MWAKTVVESMCALAISRGITLATPERATVSDTWLSAGPRSSEITSWDFIPSTDFPLMRIIRSPTFMPAACAGVDLITQVTRTAPL